MRIVVALGGNALLRRGEALTAENQRRNIRLAAEALAPLIHEHELVITHGNGPQVGLLALQGMSDQADQVFPLDILDAETEGMIGYMIEQELAVVTPKHKACATLLTQIEVNPLDPAFQNPSKPIGPVYDEDEARRLANERGWSIARDGNKFRRVVPSPRPLRILEMTTIELLVNQGVIVICTGGGGIPVVCGHDGRLIGVEAVIDKDLASALLARELKADVLLMLTDVDAVYLNWNSDRPFPIHRISALELKKIEFEPGSMAPKITAACEFVEQNAGIAGIGRLQDAAEILDGSAGTLIAKEN